MRLLLAALMLAPSAAFSAPKSVKAELGKEFTLKKGQRAELAGTDASLRLKGFVNSPCPRGVRCVWSGQAVLLELTVAGSTVAYEAPDSPYLVEKLRTDYKTWAALRVTSRTVHQP